MSLKNGSEGDPNISSNLPPFTFKETLLLKSFITKLDKTAFDMSDWV